MAVSFYVYAFALGAMVPVARVPLQYFLKSSPQADDLLMADGSWEEEENDTPLASLGADSFLLMTIWNVRCAL